MKNKNIIVPILCILSAVAIGVTTRIPLTMQSFNAGELSPLMNARSDYPKYHAGAKTLQNMLVRSQGPITRRPGTKFIAAVKDANDPTRLIPFEYSTSDAYVIEMGDQYMRFFRDGGMIVKTYAAWVTSTAYVIGDLVTSSGSYYRCLIAHTSGTFATDLKNAKWATADGATDLAYEIVSPYDSNDIFEVQYAQDAQYMRLVHPDYPPYKLTRTAHTSWTMSEITFTNGPFRAENDDTDWTLTADANTGDVNIVSTDALFDANHVGALFQLSYLMDSNNTSMRVTANGDTNSTAVDVHEGQTYDCTTGGIWGGTFKIQRSYDGGTTWQTVYALTSKYNGNVQWTGTEEEETCLYRMRVEDISRTSHEVRNYEGILDASFSTRPFTLIGIVEIKTWVDDCNVVATVIEELGDANTATWRWSEGYWSTYRGFPRSVEHHEQRCVYGGSESFPQTVWASITASGDEDYDDFDAGTGLDAEAWTYILPGMSPIQWLKSQEYLMVGTSAAIGRLGMIGKPLTPTFVEYKIQAKTGSAYIQAVAAGDGILFVERGEEKIREVSYTSQSERYIADDMTVLAEHITGDGIVQIDFQNRPDPILWCVREDGQLLSFTYNHRHGVEAWARQVTEGEFESVAIIPGSGAEDVIYNVVARNIDSDDERYVEYFQPLDWGTDQNDCNFVDCSVDDINDLDHLESETVALFANGRPIGSYIVSSGSIDPNDSNLTEFSVGLPYTSIYESMPIITSSSGMSSSLMKTAVMSVNLDLQKTMAMNLGWDADNKSAIQFSEDSYATTIDAFTGLKVAAFPRGISRDMTIYIDSNSPSPLTIRSINPTIEVYSD